MTGLVMRARLPTAPDARMVWSGWWRRWGGIARQSGVAVAVALVAYLACFPIARPVTFDVGRFPDRLVIAGFNGDERDAGVTYRWTRTDATIAIPGYGGVRAAQIEIVARNGRDARAGTPFTVDLGGDPATVGAFAQFTPVLADVNAPGVGAGLMVRLRAERYVPNNGDPRVLGVQVDRVRVEPLRMSWWAGAVGGWPWALRLALFAVVISFVVPARWRGAIGGGCAAVVALAAVAIPESRFILPPLLAPMAVAVAALGVGWRWREAAALFAAAWDALDRRAVGNTIVGALVVVYALSTVAVIRRVDFIGHADYADNAVRAANIVRGNGDVIDYVPQFYQRFPAIVHPAETWPPLQVWMIAAFFRVFGVSTVVAKLPNVAVMAALIALVAAVGAWQWNRRVGVVAAALLAATPILFEDTLFPVNDLVFSLLFALFVVAVYRAWCAPRSVATASTRWRAWMPDLLVGASAGFLLLAKPSGGLLIAGAAVAASLVARRANIPLRWPGIAVAGATALLVYAPWAIRNLATFGAPFHSTESLDAWVLKYDPKQPVEGIYAVFWGRDLPHPRLLVGYGYDHFLSVQGHQFARFWSDATSGALLPRLLIPFVLIGLIVGVSRQSGRGFGPVLAGAFAPYTLFVLLYWHDESRYFLVFVPWLLLYAASGIEWMYGALVTWFAGMWQRALVPILAALLLLGVLIPDARDIVVRAQTQTSGNALVAVSDWLNANTPPDAVIMTRNPWEVSWHSGRRTVMLPLGSLDDVYAVMRQYHVTYLELDHINDPSTLRESLKPLYSFKAMPGITPLYDPHNDAYLVFAVAPPG